MAGYDVGRTTEIISKDVPSEIIEALIADAQDRDVTMQEAAVSVLAAEFRVKRDPSNRRFIAGTEGRDTLILSVPSKLRDRIHERAFKTKGTMRGVVCSTLATHYDLPDVPLARRPKG